MSNRLNSGRDERPVVLLAGPTASGKSELALALWDRLRGAAEIVSVDSAQVYRGMDIGTAKASAATQAAIPHHLIDLIEPSEVYSAARFALDAGVAIAAVRGRGRVPILVGGTMLYFRTLLQGLSALPPANAALRAEMADEALRVGWPTLHARLAVIDPPAAARLHPNDAQRIQRALEIFQLTGEPPTALYASRPRAGVHLGRVHAFALLPDDRAALHRRIARRFEDMMARGFLDEVRALHRSTDLQADLPSIRAVGYRQLWAHLDGDGSLTDACERAIAATRQYAKRQLTWLRSEPIFLPLAMAEPNAVARVLSAVQGKS